MKNNSPPLITIIFPSYNGEDVICNNLSSIQKLNNLSEIEIIIIDNNSQDRTKDLIKTFKKMSLNLIESKRNLGFAKACNIAADKARGKFLFITNQDVVFPINFFRNLLKLYDSIKEDKELILCPAVVFEDKTINYYGAKIHFLCFSYTPEMYQKIPKKVTTFKIQKVSGCSMLLKKKIFLELNGFDPYFFMYHEDTDFSLKAIRKKIPIYTTNLTILYHQKRHTILNDFIYFYIERNRYICIIKNLMNLKNLIPYLIITEFMLIFQAFIYKKLKIRFKIYKFLIQNYKKLMYKRNNPLNKQNKKIKKTELSSKLDPIVLGDYSTNKILKLLLKVINIFF